MINRVADGIDEAYAIQTPRKTLLLMAKWAIRAMREPTEQIKAAGEYGHASYEIDDDAYISKEDAGLNWTHAIDSILKEDE